MGDSCLEAGDAMSLEPRREKWVGCPSPDPVLAVSGAGAARSLPVGGNALVGGGAVAT